MVRDGDKLLAAKEVTLAADGAVQTETMFFNAGECGARRAFNFRWSRWPGEENVLNNAVTRPVTVSDAKRRILYVEGEPRWEYKFIRRAEDDDKRRADCVDAADDGEQDLPAGDQRSEGAGRMGFRRKAEELFEYQAIIIGVGGGGVLYACRSRSCCGSLWTGAGAGCCFWAGGFRWAMAGGAASSVADLLPTFLPAGRGTFHRDAATAELTAAGADSPITRLMDDPGEECGAVEEADVHEWTTRTPGTSEAGGDGAGGDECRRGARCRCW